MKRALLALFLTPILVGFPMFGKIAIVAVPIMLVITAVIALPLLLIFKRAGWLQWWHAILAGAFCGACFVWFDIAELSVTSLDRLINTNNVAYVGFGIGIGLVYWWMGIFRNPAFPYVSRQIPWRMVIVVPSFFLIYFLTGALSQSSYDGRVVSIIEEPGPKSQVGQASVRLKDGTIVRADISNTFSRSEIEGRCFHFSKRWSTIRFRQIYELDGPLGGNGNDC